jgi:hypothetical protein
MNTNTRASDAINAADEQSRLVTDELGQGVVSLLANHVRDQFRLASIHKSSAKMAGEASVNEQLLQALRAKLNVYDPDLQASVKGVDIYMGITDTKHSAAVAWTKDTLANAEFPWTLSPTPVPSLSDEARMAAQETLMVELQAAGIELQSLPPSAVQKRLRQLEELVRQIDFEMAEGACKLHERVIQDQMVEGDYQEVWDAFIEDFWLYPAACIKAPVVRNKSRMKWDGQVLKEVTNPVLMMENVSPFDLYPSADSTNPQDGYSITEVMRMQRDDLASCMGLPGYSDDALRAVLIKFKTGYRVSRPGGDSERRALEQSTKAGAWYAHDGMIDVLDYWGKVDGHVMLEWCRQESVDPVDAFGFEVDIAQVYEMNVWVVDQYVVRAVLNPFPEGMRPFHVASAWKIPGRFWGKGIALKVRNTQRAANAAIRNLIKNMAFSAGAFAEINLDALDDEEDTPEEIAPYKIFYTRNSAAGGKAVHLDKVPSVAGELMAIYEKFSLEADKESGIPAYAMGSNEGVMKTMGAFSLQYGNALKGIKQSIRNIDRGVTRSMVRCYYLLNMLMHPDQNIKADANVVVSGANGMLAREMKQARTVETLQVLTPYVTAGLVPPQGAQTLLHDWLDMQGFSADGIMGNAAVAQAMAGAAGQPTMQSTRPGTPPPALDGRQAAAKQAMAGDNGGM